MEQTTTNSMGAVRAVRTMLGGNHDCVALQMQGERHLTTGKVWDNDCKVFTALMGTLTAIGFAGTIDWWTRNDQPLAQATEHEYHLSVRDLSHVDKAMQFVDGLLDVDRYGYTVNSWQDRFTNYYGMSFAKRVLKGAYLEDYDFRFGWDEVKRGWALHLPSVQLITAGGAYPRNALPTSVEAFLSPAMTEQVG
jgi:hypothetical protein